ncbi:nif11-like leader peptide domain protein [Synechococcus sp. BIOS-E4-1]|uniref:Nif11-like leader peptide family natural product precursor n=1 Tax=Synechococcus sp. BIOS-E4-1 TaxID=1400864 RepID=UPI001645DC18|nr:Nif11-like leader peptide family natural product precursor [Synechococcus sp. BIOS-E4-1]QNI54187.1 nif11-like leader peptide domain protein [Synechococcus sp. BIOS-E4-1]
MTQEQLTAFIANAKGNTSLQEKFKVAADANAVAEIAKEAGFSISAQDLTQAQSEISDDELEDVMGGGWGGWGAWGCRVVGKKRTLAG